MRRVRRPMMRLIITAAAAFAATAFAQGAAYPAKPIRLVIAATSGSAPDVIARLLGAKLTEAWGQQVVVDPRAGASGLIGAEIVAKSAPDGHTLWLATLTQLISTTLNQRNQMAKEFVPVGLFAGTAFAIAIHSALPAQTLGEFIALAKAKPGMMYGSAGQGTSSHLCMELAMSMAGIKLMHVPYKGSVGAMVDMAGGQVHVSCQALPAYPTYVKTGRVRVLAATTAKRSRFAPDLPLVADTLPGYELLGWYGLLAPLKTPPELIRKINAEATRIANLPDIQEKLIAAGAEAMPSAPQEFAKLLVHETAKWSKVLGEANIRPAE